MVFGTATRLVRKGLIPLVKRSNFDPMGSKSWKKVIVEVTWPQNRNVKGSDNTHYRDNIDWSLTMVTEAVNEY